MSSSSQNPSRDNYIDGLRKLAAWLEQHPDVDVPYVKDIPLPLDTNDRVEKFAAAAGVDVATDADGNTRASLHFGPIKYYGYGYVDFKQTVAKSTEEKARTWADNNGMVIQPRDGGAE